MLCLRYSKFMIIHRLLRNRCIDSNDFFIFSLYTEWFHSSFIYIFRNRYVVFFALLKRRYDVLTDILKYFLNFSNCILQIIQSSLEWLNDWQRATIKGEIAKEEFLTEETANGLRLSLQSTMDLCRYLVDEYKFQYLLTGKVNQDNLEVLDYYYSLNRLSLGPVVPYLCKFPWWIKAFYKYAFIH